MYSQQSCPSLSEEEMIIINMYVLGNKSWLPILRSHHTIKEETQKEGKAWLLMTQALHRLGNQRSIPPPQEATGWVRGFRVRWCQLKIKEEPDGCAVWLILWAWGWWSWHGFGGWQCALWQLWGISFDLVCEIQCFILFYCFLFFIPVSGNLSNYFEDNYMQYINHCYIPIILSWKTIAIVIIFVSCCCCCFAFIVVFRCCCILVFLCFLFSI